MPTWRSPSEEPPFKFVDADAPIYTHARFLPPTRVDGANIKGSMIADGCEIDAGAIIEHSIIGLRYRIGANATIKNSILMGADNYEYPKTPENTVADFPPIGIGEGSKIDGAIIDKNCRIGKNVSIHLPDAVHRKRGLRRVGRGPRRRDRGEKRSRAAGRLVDVNAALPRLSLSVDHAASERGWASPAARKALTRRSNSPLLLNSTVIRPVSLPVTRISTLVPRHSRSWPCSEMM